MYGIGLLSLNGSGKKASKMGFAPQTGRPSKLLGFSGSTFSSGSIVTTCFGITLRVNSC